MIKKSSLKKAFSLIELSISAIIIGILIAGIVSGKRLINQVAFRSAQSLTKSSSITSIPDLALWLEPTLDESITGTASGNNLSNNDSVSSWNDISGNRINLTQGTSANQPKYVKTGINNLPSLQFDGTNDILSSTTAPLNNGVNQYTMIVVWRLPAAAGTKILAEQRSTNSANNTGAAMYDNFKFSGINNDTSAMGTININTNYIGILVINNSDTNNVSGYLNSNTKTTAASANQSALNLGADIFSVGGSTGGSTGGSLFASAYISEVIIFNRNLNPSEITLINNYLSKKYN